MGVLSACCLFRCLLTLLHYLLNVLLILDDNALQCLQCLLMEGEGLCELRLLPVELQVQALDVLDQLLHF